MIKKPQKTSPKSVGGRSRYTPEFRQEALWLAVRVSVADAAEQWALRPGWSTPRGKARRANRGAKAEQPLADDAKYYVAWEPLGNDEIIASWRLC